MIEDFHKACRLGDYREMLLQVNKNPDIINKIDKKLGWSPLYLSVVCRQAASVKFLLQQGADANAKNRLGESPLHQAAYNNYIDIAEMLLIEGADPNLPQNDGDTPLHVACLKGHDQMIDLLVKYDADPSQTNKLRSKSPIDYVSEDSKQVISGIIKKKLSRSFNASCDEPLSCTKETNFDSESDKTLNSRNVSPNPLLNWLEKHRLSSVYEVLTNNGFEDLSQVLSIMQGKYPLTLSILENIGIDKPGIRMRLLARLEEEAKKKRRTSKVTSICPIFQTSIEEFLDSLSLKKLSRKFIETGLDDYNQILYLMSSNYPITDEFLEKTLGIQKIGYRHRILSKLFADAGVKQKSLSVEREELRSACECTMI